MKMIRGLFLSAVVAAASAAAAFAEDPVGRWTGTLAVPDAKLPVAIIISKGADGKLTGMAENKTQIPDPFPVESVTSDGAKLSFAITTPVTGTYEGVWDAAKKSWIGKWKQQDQEYQLDLTRAS